MTPHTGNMSIYTDKRKDEATPIFNAAVGIKYRHDLTSENIGNKQNVTSIALKTPIQ